MLDVESALIGAGGLVVGILLKYVLDRVDETGRLAREWSRRFESDRRVAYAAVLAAMAEIKRQDSKMEPERLKIRRNDDIIRDLEVRGRESWSSEETVRFSRLTSDNEKMQKLLQNYQTSKDSALLLLRETTAVVEILAPDNLRKAAKGLAIAPASELDDHREGFVELARKDLRIG